ncbi:MAG: SDR family oxidoreductase [Aggregatilineales bacterium]
MDLGLKGARVLVTAASEGLGAATARQFSLEGCFVVINSRDLGKLQQTAQSIAKESGNPVFTQAADLTNSESASKMVRNSAESMGGLDILVTNAGGPPSGSFADFDIDAWQTATQLTLMSAVSLIHASLPHLRKSRRAAILTITSLSAKQPVPNLILSNTIRPAVIGLTKSLATELGSEGIRVNSILPGMTQTARIDDIMQARAEQSGTSPEHELEKAAATIPLRRIGTVAEFANAAVFLCSPAAGYITGVSLPVDGGTIQATM